MSWLLTLSLSTCVVIPTRLMSHDSSKKRDIYLDPPSSSPDTRNYDVSVCETNSETCCSLETLILLFRSLPINSFIDSCVSYDNAV